MPATIATWVTTAAVGALGGAGLTGNALSFAAAGIYGATYVGVTLGAAYASNALLTDTPDSASAQGSIRQPIPPRIEAYGEGKLPGQYMLWEAQENYAYDVVAFHSGLAEGIDEIWSHDHILTIGPGGWVIGSPEYGGGDDDLIHIETRLGLATETAYASIVTALGPSGVWTEDHRGDGIASMGADYHHGKKENLLEDFPNGDPSWSAVGRWKVIHDPRTDTYGAFSNAAVQILDLLTSPTGLAQDYATTVAPVLEHWLTEADICDEDVPLKAGGTVKRYESFVYRALSDDPVEALGKLLAACDGRLTMDENGCYRLWVGKYREPTVWLTEEDIHGYDVSGDPAPEDVVNELAPKFKSPEHKWNIVETDPWQDSTDPAMRGKVETSPMELEAVTNNSQARRLAKREMSRLLSPIRGRLDGKLSAARAMGERWIGVDFPELGFDNAVVEIEDGGKTSLSGLTVTIPFVLADSNADAWNPASEEGNGPQGGDRIVREALAIPEISDVEVFTDSIGETTGPRLRITASGPERADLTWSARWRVVGSASWVEGTFVDIDAGTPVLLETGFVAADDLEVEVAYTTGGGNMSAWSAAYDEDATTPAVTPLPADLSASVSTDDVTVTWRYPQTPFGYVKLKRGTTPVYASATELTDEHAGGLGQIDSYADNNRPPDAYWYWIRAFAADDTPSTEVGPVQANVTQEAGTNLLTAPSDFTNAVWVKAQAGAGTLPVVTANAATAPDGTTTADRIQFVQTAGGSDQSYIYQLPAGVNAVQTGAIWLRSNTGVDQNVLLRVGDTYSTVTVKPYWDRYAVVSGNTARQLSLGLREAVLPGASSADLLVWQGHLQV